MRNAKTKKDEKCDQKDSFNKKDEKCDQKDFKKNDFIKNHSADPAKHSCLSRDSP